MERAYFGLLRHTASALVLLSVSTGTWACSFHSDQSIAQAVLNLYYPDAMHVNGAVWSLQQKGQLPLDSKRIKARGAERKMRDRIAYYKVLKALYALSISFEKISSSQQAADTAMSMVFIESMLWTRYPAGGGIKLHVSGPEPGNFVLVTDEPVVLTIAEGKMTLGEAMDNGLIRLYGEPGQKQAFLESYSTLGAKPLPKVDQVKLMRTMMYGQPLGEKNE